MTPDTIDAAIIVFAGLFVLACECTRQRLGADGYHRTEGNEIAITTEGEKA